jgi:hypothetical protein
MNFMAELLLGSVPDSSSFGLRTPPFATAMCLSVSKPISNMRRQTDLHEIQVTDDRATGIDTLYLIAFIDDTLYLSPEPFCSANS